MMNEHEDDAGMKWCTQFCQNERGPKSSETILLLAMSCLLIA